MIIQSCPVKVLDNIFECTVYSDSENGQTTLCSLTLTCSYYRKITKRHFVRIVCLSRIEKVNKFTNYLPGVVESDEYGTDVLLTQH